MQQPMKRILFAFSLTAVFANAALAIEVPEPFKSQGYLRVGMETNSPPMEFQDIKTGKLVGFNVEMVETIAKYLNLDVKYEMMDVPSMSPALDTGRIDMIGSHFNDTPARHRKFTFVDYLSTGPIFYTTRENLQVYKEASQICGKAVGAPEHTTYYRLIGAWSKANCPADQQVEIIGTKGLPDTQLQIRQGRLVAGAIGAEKISYWANDPENKFGGVGERFHSQLYGFAFLHANSALRDSVKQALEAMNKSGEYAALIVKYGLDEQQLSEITIDAGKD
jgi:polar amino acid transport system substrate-binding protein